METKDIAKVVGEIWKGAEEMGLFDEIGKKVAKGAEKAVKTVAKGAATVVGWVKDVFGTTQKENTQKALEKAQREAREARAELEREKAKNAEKIADSLGDESYDADTASAYEIRRMNEELYEMQESFRKTASDIEESIIECIQGTVRDMLEQFESINDTAGLNLNMAYLKSVETSLGNQVTGFIQNRVKRSLSLDNQECKDILKMEGRTAKKMAMQRFQEKIFSDAVSDLWELVKDTFNEKNSAIFTQIETRFQTIEMNAEESIRQFEEIQKVKQLDKEQLKEKQENYQNMIDIAVWCMQSIEGDTLV